MDFTSFLTTSSHVFNDLMIQSHVTKMDVTTVKTAAGAKCLAYLSPLPISFQMLYNTTESNKNLFPTNGVT